MKKQIINLIIITLISTFSIMAQEVTGTWNGAIEIQGMQLRIVFNIDKNDTGYSSTMDSPDQGAKGIKMDETTFKENTLNIKAAAMAFEYNGKISEDQTNIDGKVTQGGMEMPLTLKREKIEKKETEKRPQDPIDFPYEQEDIKFVNPKGGHSLAGTLTTPSDGNFDKVVVLISGSGPQNRNEEVAIFNHRPFLVLSDYLTRKNIAVLRYDDRGVGESEGDQEDATSKDFADDVIAAVDFLKTRKEFNGKKIGLAGHSEGGMIAPIVASERKDIDFIVLMAGPGVPIQELMVQQSIDALKDAPIPEETKSANVKIVKEVYDCINADKSLDGESIKPELNKILAKGYDSFPEESQKEIGDKDAFIESQLKTMTGKWFMYFLRFDPAQYVSKVQCPVLAVNGALDIQVSAKENLAGIKKALEEGGNKDFEIKMFDNQNHLFQTAETGAISEYKEIEETFNEGSMKYIADWINKQ